MKVALHLLDEAFWGSGFGRMGRHLLDFIIVPKKGGEGFPKMA
jgi:hypothetical protein